MDFVEIPEAFAAATVAREGQAGRDWVKALPDLIRGLCREWNVVPNGVALHGYVAVVIPVGRGHTDYVLKVSWIDESSAQEAIALRTWAGRGAVQLIEAESSRGAMLLERLDTHRTLDALPVDEAVQVAGELLRRLAVEAPQDVRLVAEEAAGLRSRIPILWEETGEPCSRKMLDDVLSSLELLATQRSNRMVNQDLHYGNVLAGTREPWLVIDPKILAGELEYGVAQLLWCRFSELEGPRDLRRRLSLLVDVAQLDPQRARDWAFVRVVAYWLWALSVGLTEDPQKCRALAEWL